MTFNISFQERAKLSTIILSKQPAVTLKEAKEQAQWLKTNSSTKKKETKSLIQFAEDNNLWVDINIDLYVSQGAEQKVYLKDGLTIL
jgi:uncharacterized membrane protein YcaP (DUF421 family)